MNFDLRLPIGMMFTIYGVLLTITGIMNKSGAGANNVVNVDNININLVWGLVLLAFGGFMLLLAWRASKAPAPAAEVQPATIKR